MKKALVIPASAVAVALGVYVAGVYYTDYKVNEVLSNLDEIGRASCRERV